MSWIVRGGFLTNGKIAWDLSNQAAESYADGTYKTPEGWWYVSEILAESQDLAGCYRLTSRPAEDAGRS